MMITIGKRCLLITLHFVQGLKIVHLLDELKAWIEGDIENIYCSATWVDLKHILNHNPTPMKAQFLPLFNVNSSQPQLNSISTKLQLNLISTSFQWQPQFNLSLNINLNSTSTLISTQYDCGIKATQSCKDNFQQNIYHWIYSVLQWVQSVLKKRKMICIRSRKPISIYSTQFTHSTNELHLKKPWRLVSFKCYLKNLIKIRKTIILLGCLQLHIYWAFLWLD